MNQDDLTDLGLGSLAADQQMEQAEAGLEKISMLLAMMYRTLLRYGVPHETAEALVLQQHEALLSRSAQQ